MRKEVKGVDVRGQWYEDPEVVRKEAKNLFEDEFKTTKDLRVILGAIEFKSVS